VSGRRFARGVEHREQFRAEAWERLVAVEQVLATADAARGFSNTSATPWPDPTQTPRTP
jgi:hypothetical protein